MSEPVVLVETVGRVRVLRLNRPKALNALNREVAAAMVAAAQAADADPAIGCIVVTGSEKAFAAGADIAEMKDQTAGTMAAADWFGEWEAFAAVRKPVIAAVSGYALGGGCELAMMCDIILAADTAKFGQPEIKLGVMPGMGGSQRLARAIGQTKAMEMCLSGRMMDAAEAERSGLVARVVPATELHGAAMELATTIASMSLPAVLSIKESIRRASEVALTEGVRFERRVFHALFAGRDQTEGMTAFLEKRAPQFTHE
ncbi:enoyl-CoA hydratase [Acuticoccus sediminis]|uniref:enoyl-CoA hydratase n=1 Tax=Acuticoccus sediminis TaxID=2184697 RepID=UPI001CFE8502|nr:enoyl-CoA hydratase [Acuticoccus sediminis]